MLHPKNYYSQNVDYYPDVENRSFDIVDHSVVGNAADHSFDNFVFKIYSIKKKYSNLI